MHYMQVRRSILPVRAEFFPGKPERAPIVEPDRDAGGIPRK
jgi:hypothetical protein